MLSIGCHATPLPRQADQTDTSRSTLGRLISHAYSVVMLIPKGNLGASNESSM